MRAAQNSTTSPSVIVLGVAGGAPAGCTAYHLARPILARFKRKLLHPTSPDRRYGIARKRSTSTQMDGRSVGRRLLLNTDDRCSVAVGPLRLQLDDEKDPKINTKIEI